MADRQEAVAGEARAGRNVLVVSTVEQAEELLREHVGEADTVKVVVPVVRQGFHDWLANDEKAFGRAEQVAARTAEIPIRHPSGTKCSTAASRLA